MVVQAPSVPSHHSQPSAANNTTKNAHAPHTHAQLHASRFLHLIHTPALEREANPCPLRISKLFRRRAAAHFREPDAPATKFETFTTTVFSAPESYLPRGIRPDLVKQETVRPKCHQRVRSGAMSQRPRAEGGVRVAEGAKAQEAVKAQETAKV